MPIIKYNKMGKELKELNFNGIWRPYQKRVLDELDEHLEDKKLNVVAAPGAGKTILGIEVVRRLNKPVLIFAPTITIRNQWAQRIKENFLSDENKINIISTDINDIKKISIVTYQALHSISKREDEYSAFLEMLKFQEIKTILFDEAHHLKVEWYKTLIKLKKELLCKDYTFVSLTATPPYDVSIKEWENYHALCGPVDAEVSIPELVKCNNLCPHQDLIYFCNLVQDEQEIIKKFEENRNVFFKYIKNDIDFSSSIKTSDFLNDFEKNIELIYTDTAFTISLISYLLNEDPMLLEAHYLIEFLGIDVSSVPKFDYAQAEILFNGYLGEFKNYFSRVDVIYKKLKELELLIRKDKVDFLGAYKFKNVFQHSIARLSAIDDITNHEYSVLGNDLREVILLDYIKKDEGYGVNIVSVFEKLKNKYTNIGILTGSLVVIPHSAKENLQEVLDDLNYDINDINISEYNKGYYSLVCGGKIDIVSIVTELFSRGFINIIIGTQAFLGEGWDAPCINTLIIASTISSFVTSNQMRGRALRIDKNNPEKTANIWHIVTMYNNGYSPDYDAIVKRFETFEGVSYIENTIKCGIERLGISSREININNFDKIIKTMFSRAKKRNKLSLLWKQVFDMSSITEENMVQQIYDVIETKNNKIPAVFINTNVSQVRKHINLQVKKHYLNITLKEHLLLAKFLYKTLFDNGILKSNKAKINIKPDDLKLSYVITVTNCTNYERNLFLKAYNEIFTPSENARYIFKKQTNYSSIIEKEKTKFKVFNIFTMFSSDKYILPECILNPDNYYFIPEIMGKNKTLVEAFMEHISLDFGYFDVIYTRTPQGRKELLKANCLMKDKKVTKKTRCWL